MDKEIILWNIIIPTFIGYVLTVMFSYFTWIGIVIGPAVAGYITRKYKYTLLNTIIIGLTAWPTVFLIKKIVIGPAMAKALSVAGFFYTVALAIGFLISIISGVLGASLGNILSELRKPKVESKGE